MRAFLCFLISLWALACSGVPLPVVEPALRSSERVPVVLVPGITGVELREADSGKLVWGSGSRLLFPHDGGYSMVNPLDPTSPARGRVGAGQVIEQIRLLGVIRKEVYGLVARVMEANGYRRGDLDRPRPDDTFFFFEYDWRQDNVESARKLQERLEELRLVRGEERLEVALVCQSNGANICRYLAKYGGATLNDVEDGVARRPISLDIQKLILVGNSNGGGLRVLKILNRGRRYIRVVGRKWQPEAFFTFVSLYQDLPAFRDDFFVDEHGNSLDVDLYDAAHWERFGWSIYQEKVQKRLERKGRPDLFGDGESRSSFLHRVLIDAKRFQKALHRDGGALGSTRYYLIHNVELETPERAVLVEAGKRWRTYFTGDRWLEERPRLHDLVTGLGDGHATRASQMWFSPQELARIAGEPFHAEGEHFEIILNPSVLKRLVEILAEP